MKRFILGLVAILLATPAFAQNLPLDQYQPGPRLIDGNQLNQMVNRVTHRSFANVFGKIATADDGTTQTLTAAMITGGFITYHVTTGGTTPSLTLPLVTAINTALPSFGTVNLSYVLRIINTNSGTATVVTNTGWTTSGTLTIATNTWREFLIVRTANTTLSITSIGTGTTS